MLPLWTIHVLRNEMCLVFIILMEKGVPTCTASSECGHVMYDDVREGTEKEVLTH